MPFKLIVILVLLVIFVFEPAGAALACDTWIALAIATERRFTFFAKNSDRPLSDSQP